MIEALLIVETVLLIVGIYFVGEAAGGWTYWPWDNDWRALLFESGILVAIWLFVAALTYAIGQLYAVARVTA